MLKVVFTLVMLGLIGQSALAIGGRCEESYIPPHTYEEMVAVKDWATGGAFSSYAKQAGVVFDVAAYNEDNPYRALFNFSRATGISCVKMDLTTGYVSMMWVFNQIHRKMVNGEYEGEETFQEYYLEKAEEYGFDQYILEVNEDPIN